MDSFRWTIVGIAVVIVVVMVAALSFIIMPGAAPQANARVANSYTGMVPAGELLRVPVTGIYPGGSPAGPRRTSVREKSSGPAGTGR